MDRSCKALFKSKQAKQLSLFGAGDAYLFITYEMHTFGTQVYACLCKGKKRICVPKQKLISTEKECL